MVPLGWCLPQAVDLLGFLLLLMKAQPSLFLVKGSFPLRYPPMRSLWKQKAKSQHGGTQQARDLHVSWWIGEWLCARHFNLLSLRFLIFETGLVVTIAFNYSLTI